MDSDSDLACDTEAEEGCQVTEQAVNNDSDTADDADAGEETLGIFPITASQRVAPNKVIWSRTPIQRSVPRQPPTPYRKGLASDEARAGSLPSDFLALLMDDSMLNEIVRCTNIQIEEKGKNMPRIRHP